MEKLKLLLGSRVKRAKLDSLVSVSRFRSIQMLMGLLVLYVLLMSLEMPLVFKTNLELESPALESTQSFGSLPLKVEVGNDNDDDLQKNEQLRSSNVEISGAQRPVTRWPERKMGEFKKVSGLIFDDISFDRIGQNDFSELHKAARDAFVTGKKVLEDIQSGKLGAELENRTAKNWNYSCPSSISTSEIEFKEKGKLMVIPCGLTLGSHITVVGRPRWAHAESNPNIALEKDVSQFIMELQGLKNAEGEDPPKILHFNPRLKGDFSGRPVIEKNTCYRMQWGVPQRCEGWRSEAAEETVDGQVKCEKWHHDPDGNHLEESRTLWWLKRLIGRSRKVSVDWPYPFVANKLFVLTLSAGLEGYHVNVDGRHVTSFPYRIGFTLEDATGLYISGDVDVHSIFAASLPTSHPSFDPQRHLEMLSKWQAPPLPSRFVDLFVGILSAGSHFAERMAVRKSWMQHKLIKSSNVVARFFVAMHGRAEVNAEVLKEAEFFGDIVIVPYMDKYDLVVLKTVAICEYGVRTVAANYIMKCDDDTFVRIDAVMKEVMKVKSYQNFYMGNINLYHRPLRNGKWAVTYEEWPDDEYPQYANGPGYIISSGIAEFIVSEFEQHKLRLFKMEDVSMGMWVENFNISLPVDYVHSLKFCQFGCVEDYLTAHYQSPKQMICLWRKLQVQGKASCCNVR